MQKYRVRLADREYTIVLSEKNEAEENVSVERTLRINLLGKYDAIADSIGKKRIDKETAKLLISLFLRKMRGYPLAEYSVLLFGEETEVNICDTVDGHILYSAPAGFELSYKRATLPDLVELALCTAYISGKRIRIYEAENIESVGTELLKRLKIVEGLPSAAYAIAVERADSGVRFKFSETDVSPEAYILPFRYYTLGAGESIYDAVGKCKITLREDNKLLIPYVLY